MKRQSDKDDIAQLLAKSTRILGEIDRVTRLSVAEKLDKMFPLEDPGWRYDPTIFHEDCGIVIWEGENGEEWGRWGCYEERWGNWFGGPYETQRKLTDNWNRPALGVADLYEEIAGPLLEPPEGWRYFELFDEGGDAI